MEINVKSSGSTKSFQLKGVEASITVLELKSLCAEACGLAREQQRLFYKGKLLKDEDALEALNIGDKANLFLVKGASSSAASGSAGASGTATEDKETKKEEEEKPAVSVPCVGGCGFFGSSRTENFCSQCFAKKQQKEKTEAEKAKQEGKEGGKKEEGKKEESAGASAEGAPSSAAKEGEEADAAMAEAKEEQTDKTKCWFCGKKCGLTGFECRCGYVFCSKHRYAEDHNCNFDHKGKGREIIAKNNPNVTRSVLDGV